MKVMTHSIHNRRRQLLRMLFVFTIALIVGAVMPALSQPRNGTGAMNGPKNVGGGEPHYLLFWRSPERASDLIKTIGAQGDGNRTARAAGAERLWL